MTEFGSADLDVLRHHVSHLKETYRRMRLVRQFEEQVSKPYRDGEVPGFVHLSLGRRRRRWARAGLCGQVTSFRLRTEGMATAWLRVLIRRPCSPN